jgi:hypothetical protein
MKIMAQFLPYLPQFFLELEVFQIKFVKKIKRIFYTQ